MTVGTVQGGATIKLQTRHCIRALNTAPNTSPEIVGKAACSARDCRKRNGGWHRGFVTRERRTFGVEKNTEATAIQLI